MAKRLMTRHQLKKLDTIAMKLDDFILDVEKRDRYSDSLPYLNMAVENLRSADRNGRYYDPDSAVSLTAKTTALSDQT